MSFSCTLTKSGVKAFSRTLACLHKIGSEVSIEALTDKLMMRTLAPSHAAYALVVLKPEFFEPLSFSNKDTDGNPMASQSSSEPHAAQFVKCKLHLKQLQLVFRHANLIDRMDLLFVGLENRLLVSFQCGGITSKYSIPFESQTNILQADYPRSSTSSTLQFKSAVLLKNLDNFSAKLSEITLIVESSAVDGLINEDSDLRIRLKSFEQQAQANAVSGGLQSLEEPLITESTIPTTQFERYTVSIPNVELTFNLKEVRAFLQYCDSLVDYDVSLQFNGMGLPMMLETVSRHGLRLGADDASSQSQRDQGEALKMELVVATLAESQTQHSQSSTPQPAARQQQPQQQQYQHQSQAPSVSQAFLQKQSAAQPAQPHSEGEEFVPQTPQ